MLSSCHGNDVDITTAGLAFDIVARGNYQLLAEFKERLNIFARNQCSCVHVFMCACVCVCVSVSVYVVCGGVRYCDTHL